MKLGQVSDMRFWIRENYEKYKHDRYKLIDDCVKKFSRKPRRVSNMIAEMRHTGELPPDAFVLRHHIPRHLWDNENEVKIGLEKIEEDCDDVGKLREGINSLGNYLIKDNDFRLEMGMSFDRWRRVSNLSEFEDNKQEVKGKRFRGIYWGSKYSINSLRQKIRG